MRSGGLSLPTRRGLMAPTSALRSGSIAGAPFEILTCSPLRCGNSEDGTSLSPAAGAAAAARSPCGRAAEASRGKQSASGSVLAAKFRGARAGTEPARPNYQSRRSRFSSFQRVDLYGRNRDDGITRVIKTVLDILGRGVANGPDAGPAARLASDPSSGLGGHGRRRGLVLASAAAVTVAVVAFAVIAQPTVRSRGAHRPKTVSLLTVLKNSEFHPYQAVSSLMDSQSRSPASTRVSHVSLAA